MKHLPQFIVTLILAIAFIAPPAYAADITWVEKSQNPACFPYLQGTADLEMDMPIPYATNRWFEVSTAYQSTDYYYTNIAIWSENDPMYGQEGYWPTYHSAAIFANGKYYIGGGVGPNVNLSSINGNFRHATYSGDALGYHWPSNTFGQGYTYNRQSALAVYDPAADTWNAAKWDGSGPVGYNINGGTDPSPGAWKTDSPTVGQGTWIGANQAFAFDVDEDGSEEIFMHGGYPHWDGYCAIYDPDRNEGKGAWSRTSNALSFSGGNQAQMYGGSVRITSNIWCIGGNFWGPDDGTHMQKYSVPDDTWEKFEYLYNKKLRNFGIATVGSKIYMMSGSENGVVTNNIYVVDTENIAAGITIAGKAAVGVEYPSMISWKGVLYMVGGLNANGPTNLFQIFNPLTGATVIHEARLPLNTYAASCAVSPDGTFYFGGALRIQENGKFYNTSRLWTAPLPEQDLFSAPTILNYWQTNDTLQVRLDNVTGLEIVCTVATEYAWLDIPNGVVTVGANAEYVDVTINRTALSGPTNGMVSVSWGASQVSIMVQADTPRPIGVLEPTSTLTLQPKTKQYTIYNNGSVPMNFTNSTTAAYLANITPATGVIPPLSNTVVSFDVTAAAPRPRQGTIDTTYNSFDGETLTFTINNYPTEYYVAVDGDNSNDGMSLTSAWLTIAHGVTNMPNGSESEGAITLNVGPGTYAGESTEPSGTNWTINLSNREYISIIGAGPEKTFLTRGTANWVLGHDNDVVPAQTPIQIWNASNVRVSGMTIVASDPPRWIDGDGDYPEHCAAIGINNSDGIRIDHIYIDGMFTGTIWNATAANWQSSWIGWWYHGIDISGVVGPQDIQVDHVLIRGFERSIYNNNAPTGGDDSNVNFVNIDHCTFIQNICPSGEVHSVNIRVDSAQYGPSFMVHNSIISDIPWSGYSGSLSAEGLTAAAISSLNNYDFTLLSQSNQFYSVGLPVPGVNYVNVNVVQEDEIIGLLFTDYTNEPPVFIAASGLPYSTDVDTEFGYRDVGWNPVPEPAGMLAVLVLAAISIKRFIK